MRDRHFLRSEGLGHADHMRLHHAVCRRGDAKIAIGGVRTQALVEIFLAMMA
jgi:hypothetical protein